jgi:LuxR family maltose regulon positive regulatory protein
MAEAVSSVARALSQARPARSRPRFELLESKLRAPQRHGRAVPRTALISLLEEADAVPVAVVSAGPGWGKTTLLAQWASRSRRPFAWVSVDHNDNDPIVLLTYVAVALDRLSPVDASVFDALASPGVSVEGTVVPRLGAALATIDEPVVLALDDLHLLDNPTCLDAIATLARHVSAGSQMILSARGGPVFPLGALRAHGLAREIGSDDLRMDETAARRLLSASGVGLPDKQLTELTEHTEGWPAGLYLAALSIRARGVKAAGASTFSGSDRLVSDYLQSELLAHMSAKDVRFLTRTAVLERMSGPLCDAVLEASGSAAILESRARSNLFLVPLDAHREWYRYHHLFRELLHAELVRAEPELVPLLLARAADWCEANGQPEAAIGYARDAGDVNRAARLIEQRAVPAYHSGHVATAEGWLHWLERNGALERNAAVAVLGALDATAQGRPAEAERWAEAAEQASYEGPLPDGTPSIDSWRAVLRAMRCQRGVAMMRADAEFAVRTLARSSPLRPSALVFYALSRWLAGEVDESDDLLADVAEEGLELGAEEVAAVALAERAAVAIERGAWVEAEEFADSALRVIRRWRMGEYPTSALACALAARVALHRGETQRAHELLARSQRLRPRLTYAAPYFAVQSRLELARAYIAMVDAGGAETMMREIDALLRRQPDLGTLPGQAEELRARLKTMRADAPGASTLTEAELRLLPYLATHLSFREIGERRYVSRHTVKSHAVAVYRKLNVSSRNGAVERARELGLL